MDMKGKEEIYLTLVKRFITHFYKDEFFLDVIDFINENPIFFDSELFIKLFNSIPKRKKIDYWNLLIRECTVEKKFDIYDINLLIKTFDDINDKLRFVSLLVTSSFFPVVFINDIIELLELFDNKKFNVLDMLFDNNKIRKMLNYQVRDLFLQFSNLNRKEMVYYFRKKVPEIFDDSSLLWVLQLLEKDEIITTFKDLIINDDKFNEKILFENLDIETDVNLTFFLLDLYISDRNQKYNDSQKRNLLERLKRYIVDFNDYFCKEYPSGEIIYDEINKLICCEHNLNCHHFKKLINVFGYDVFHYLDCINIIKLINLDSDNFQKILNLFSDKNTTLDQHTLSNVLNAFYQREFLLEKKDEYMLFGEFEKLIKEQNKLEILKKLKLIAEKVDVDKILNDNEITFNEFINKLLQNIKPSKDILHSIVNKYLMISREDFVVEKLNNAHLDLNLIWKVEKNIAKNYFFKNNSVEYIIKRLSLINKNKLTSEQINLLNNYKLLEQVILYKINPTATKFDCKFTNSLSALEKMVNILWENDEIILNGVSEFDYVYYPRKINSIYLLGILSELNIDQVRDKLLNNTNLYKKLYNILEKYKILGWGDTFERLSNKIDLTIDATVIATLINYFYMIDLELFKSNNNGLTKMMVYANCYASTTNKFAYLFGKDDYQLICVNGGNYKAPAPKNKRLELAVSHLIEMYQKDTVTIPSYDKDYTLKNGKTINVVVGNATNIKNLTIGERTDSCLRICGMFYELYKFVISDKKGFNICFYDKNNKLVSRVSGIRNGNTVFLNQLRNSLTSEFENTDLHELITLVCNDLLEITKKSVVPIDNVVISTQEALNYLESENQYIGEDVFKENLYDLPFNYDLDGFAYLLASREPGTFIKKDFSVDLPEYKCCNDKVVVYNDFEQANNRFIQFNLINQLLNGKNINEIQIPNLIIKSCISNDKFIIANDFNDKIIIIKLDKYRDDPEINDIINNLCGNLFGLNIKGVIK